MKINHYTPSTNVQRTRLQATLYKPSAQARATTKAERATVSRCIT